MKDPITKLEEENHALKKELAWYKAFADQVQSTDHRAYNYACQHADHETVNFPYEEGDVYWTIEELEDEIYTVFSPHAPKT